MQKILSELQEPGGPEKNAAIFKKVQPPASFRNEDAEAMGKWVSEYLKDGGYFLDGGWPAVYKQMIIRAFPPINTDGEINAENIEPTMIRFLANVNTFLQENNNNAALRGFRGSVVV